MASKQSTDTRIRFPIEQKEQAAQREHSTLLARDIYSTLADLLTENLNNLPTDDDLDQNRSHSAILIDGKRGTGKSSVLVNLSLYLKGHENKELAKDIHVLKPVDPTLLEHSDDLFLNVIVAAIIRDQAVAKALSEGTARAEEFHHQLQILGNTLEALQSQRSKLGLDKLRAFMGSQDLHKQVHELFKKALMLIGKKLLVLPIDDVDTSLDRAFENLEVVRRYLTSPYVQPIISGHLALYHQVTWRDFQSKLVKNNETDLDLARETAEDLAIEYERKIMPLHLRMEMPTVLSYLNDQQIQLSKDDEDYFSLPVFWRWIDALLNERVNDLPNRKLTCELETVRELAQLVFAFRKEIPLLSNALRRADVSLENEWSLHRLMFMPTGVFPALEAFPREYQRAQRMKERSQRETARDRAYKSFFENANGEIDNRVPDWLERIIASKKILLAHLRYKRVGSAACLALEADIHFATLREQTDKRLARLFNTPLFEPYTLSQASLETFPDQTVNPEFQDWQGRLPEEWAVQMRNHPAPYALPEAGHAIKRFHARNLSGSGRLIVDLMLERSYFSESRQAATIFSGRIFELVIASLVRDIEPHDFTDLLGRKPFHSTSDIISKYQDHLEIATDESNDEAVYELIDLCEQINEWRAHHHIDRQLLSGWLTYNVMNHYFVKSWEFNKPLRPNQNPGSVNLEKLLIIARGACRTLWNAFASVEKGEIFGMPLVLTTFNVGVGENFEQNLAYKQNIQAFMRTVSERSFGRDTRSYAYALASHPLFDMIEQQIEMNDVQELLNDESQQNEKSNSRDVTTIIKRYFNISGRIEEGLQRITPDYMDIVELEKRCKDAGIEHATLAGNPYFNYLIDQLIGDVR